MDRLSAADAAFFFAETENTPQHIGSVAVFEGPAPTYGDVVRFVMSKLHHVPRYRQRVREVPMHVGRPLWVDDEHFQILYHVRHTALPRPGGRDELRNLAGRVLAQRLDLSKPLWESWLVEGLEDDKWALISKVHHCMIDGVAGVDLTQVMYDHAPDAPHEEPRPWTPQRPPSDLELIAAAMEEAARQPFRMLLSLVGAANTGAGSEESTGSSTGSRDLERAALERARRLTAPVADSLNGRIGPHRRWAWTEIEFAQLKAVSAALGGTVNDIVLTVITRALRDLLQSRGALGEGMVVRTMVPVSVRSEIQRGVMTNQVTSVFVDLPVAEPDALARLSSVREQMDEHKKDLQGMDLESILGLADLTAPAILALTAGATAQAVQPYVQAVTTNVPGPRIPMYLLGRKMLSSRSYVQISGGIRISIAMFSYLGEMTFGITADFDAFPDIDVLAEGITHGMDELNALKDKQQGA